MERRDRAGMMGSGDGPNPEPSVGPSSAAGTLFLLASFGDVCGDAASCFSPGKGRRGYLNI